MGVELPAHYMIIIAAALLFLAIGGNVLLSQRDLIERAISVIFGSLSFA